MAQSDNIPAGPAPGASGKEGGHTQETNSPAKGHVAGGTATSTPAPGESKSADPSERV